MLQRLRLPVLLVSTPLAVLVLVGGLLGGARSSAQTATRDLPVFDDVVRLIQNAYVEPAEMDTVMDGAMRGLTDSLDSSTSYLTPAEVRALETNAPLPAGELGLTVTRQYYLRVIGVEDGSPAARAGLRSGDYIRAIDETPTRDMSAFTGTRLLSGPVGSTVDLLIIRGNTADPHEVSLVREASRSVRAIGRQLPTGEAYVRVTSFDEGAASAIEREIRALGAMAQGGVILDLRDVADGPALEGIEAARPFVADGILGTREGRRDAPTVYRTEPEDGAFDVPIVLLVSSGTAQAAELFAAALADNNRALLVGEPTAGLAGVQTLVPLPDGHGLWMTTERYVRADGTPIHDGGLRPDALVVRPVIEFGDLPPAGDEMLERAVTVLHEGPGAASDQADAPAPAAVGPPTQEP